MNKRILEERRKNNQAKKTWLQERKIADPEGGNLKDKNRDNFMNNKNRSSCNNKNRNLNNNRCKTFVMP